MAPRRRGTRRLPCNAEYDLIPSWINAAVALLVAGTVVCLVVMVRLSWRQRSVARTGDWQLRSPTRSGAPQFAVLGARRSRPSAR